MSGTPEDHSTDPDLALTIGAVSRSTGIPVNTLRTWERRYGFPTPRRSDGGQRLYHPQVVARLRLVARALELGHRPRQVVGLPFEQLRKLVGPNLGDAEPVDVVVSEIESWIQAARQLDGETLERGFQSECARLGLEVFLQERASPFLRRLGEAWSEGELDVAHEHFASDRLRHFLTSSWRPLSDRARGASIVCANLPGEQHFLGLHMAAAMAALYGFRVIFLGPNTPLTSIASSVRQSDAVAVMISVSSSAAPDEVVLDLGRLRALLPAPVELLVGGAGAPRSMGGVNAIERLKQLSNWAAATSGLGNK